MVDLWLFETSGGPGVTADLFRLADLFRRNLYASGYVPVFKEFHNVEAEKCTFFNAVRTQLLPLRWRIGNCPLAESTVPLAEN